jgi:hypothetical protein
MPLELCPVTIGDARAFVERYHRHHHAPQSGLFAVAVAYRDNDGTPTLVGVAIIGRPVARGFQDGYTAEVTRCCTLGTFNAPSMLYGAAWRAARSLGYRRLITYTMKREPGTSLRAAGWRVVAETRARSWSKDSKARPRVDRSDPEQRRLWERNVADFDLPDYSHPLTDAEARHA